MHVIASESQRSANVARVLWTWFACGCVALLLVPGLHDRDPTFGWLGYWCVLAPLIDLLVLHRARLPMVAGTLLVRTRRHRPLHQAQRIRLRRRRGSRRHALLAALFNP